MKRNKRFWLGIAGLLLWIVALILGAYGHYVLKDKSLVDFHRTNFSECYRTDALLIYYECLGTPADHLFGWTLTWAYFWTWGAWSNLFPPVGVLYGVPAIVALYFAIRLVVSTLRGVARG